MTTSANERNSNLVLNGGSSLRELLCVIDGIVSFSSQASVDTIGRRLIELARQAWLSRQTELLDQTIRTILSLPLNPRLHAVAKYYDVFALCNLDNSKDIRTVLETLIENSHPAYRARIVLALGGSQFLRGDLYESAKTYLEALRIAADTDPLSQCSAVRDLALVRSVRGDHKGSLADLERLFPVMRSFATSYPDDYRYYLNNLAYELGQVGRIEEARAAINVALRSPYADRFPDWAETAQEIETMRRRVFLPLVFAIGLPALGVPAALDGPALGVSTAAGIPEAGLSVKASDEPARNLNVPSVTED